MVLNGWQYKKRRLIRNVRWWMRDHEPLLRIAGLCLIALSVLVTVVQLAYPTSRVLPLVRVGDQRVGGSSTGEVSRHIDELYSGASITVKTASKDFKLSFEEAGVDIDAGLTAKKAADYPFWERLIPFSSVVVALSRNTAPVTTFDSAKLGVFADRVAKEGAVAPVDAKIIADGAKAKLVPSQPSKAYPAKATADALRAASYEPQTTVSLVSDTKPANRTDEEVGRHLDEAQRSIDTPLTLTFEAETAKPDKKTVASWLTFSEVAPAYDLKIELKHDAVAAYLATAASKIYKAPGTTKIHLIDDREVDRETGAAGHGIIVDKAIAAVDAAIQKGEKTTLSLQTGKLDPIVEYDRQYSNTDQRLVSLMNKVSAAHPGYGIAMMKVDGPSVNVNGNKQFVAASTYKLYVAYAVVKEVEAGRMSWSESLGSRTVAQCFDDMIVVSDNSCPKAFGSRIGWRTITAQMHDLGLSNSTQLGSSMYTTSNDLAYFLYRLEKGSLMSSAGRDRLIDAMKRQSYTRAGIPKGAGGTVADKVGDVDGYLHDAAIVYGSGKTYVLVVMTYGGAWSGIADAAQQINAGL
ncbi:MAG TPA: serine hydrolase [Candidatus Saccharimonadales bacterium]|nr:serine hydrolase [Candidatus Saccharimonadales bacterium]